MNTHPAGRFFVDRDRIWGDTFSIHYSFMTKRGEVCVALPVSYKVLEDPDVPVERIPMMTVPASAAQQLMDDLWLAGFRPTEGTGSAGAYAAVQKHLEDMRHIAFSKLSVPIPPSK